MRWSQWIYGLLLLAGCSGGELTRTEDAAPSSSAASIRDRRIALEAPDDDDGLRFKLSAGEAVAVKVVSPIADAKPLAPARASRLLGRLAELDPPATESFAFPPDVRPPPETHRTVDKAFPPPEKPVARADGPTPTAPSIVRRAPEGPVPIAPRITVTFSDAVAPLTSATDVPAERSPLMVAPEVEGAWRWLSTRTLVFEPAAERLPMGTDFRVTARAGWTAANGAKIDEPIRWTFSTPAPSVREWFPTGDRVRPGVVAAVVFDQPVDADEVRKFVTVDANGETVGIRAPTATELADAKTSGWWSRARNDDRVVPFVTERSLPTNAAITVRLAPGWRGREGPREVTETYEHRFRTYPPLELTAWRCSWRNDCPPLSPFFLQFNNALDGSAFDADALTVEPAIANMKVGVAGESIALRGLTEGRTTYAITVPADVTDVFGQKLGRARTVEVEVGEAEPQLFVARQGLVVLDPAGARRLDVFSINYPRLEFRAWRVEPEDWNRFLRNVRQERGLDEHGRPAVNETITVEKALDRVVATPLDLDPVLGEDGGHAIVEIRPPRRDLTGWRRDNPPIIRQWIQRTKLGLQVRVGRTQMLAWVTDLSTGAAIAGATVELLPGDEKATTDEGGLARLDLPEETPRAGGVVVATRGRDRVLVPEGNWYRDASNWVAPRDGGERLRAFIFDDRRMYRPGETVHLKGWLRRETAGPEGDLLPLEGRVRSIEATAYDAQGAKIVEKTFAPNAFGGFDFEVALPDDVNLGDGRIAFEIRAADDKGLRGRVEHRFSVQAFRRPEFEVEVSADEAPHRVGEFATVSAEARYYSGGPLPDAAVAWQVEATEARYDPPGHPEYSFGRWIPWWIPLRPFDGPRGGGPVTRQTYAGKTDASGRDDLRIDLLGVDPPGPTTLTVRAAVTDVNRQTWSAETNVLVHPSDLYVGVRLDQGFGEAGQPVEVSGLVVDIDGAPQANRTVTATLAQIVWKTVNGEWTEVEEDPTGCRARSDDRGRLTCRLTPPEGGRYRLSAVVTDDRGRANLTTRTLWVSGPQRAPDRGLEGDTVTLVPDRKTYEPGATARVLVRAPFADGQGLLTVEREGLAEVRRFAMKGTSHVVEVPIAERAYPEVAIAVEVVGQKPREGAAGLTQPAFAHGSARLEVSDRRRRLQVSAAPADTVVSPGDETSVAVTVTDGDGRPVAGAEVAIVVVDEAVLALTNAQTPDPLPTFYPRRSPGVQLHRTRDRIVLADPDLLTKALDEQAPRLSPRRDGAARESLMMLRSETSASMTLDSAAAMADSGGDAAAPIAVRRDFSALAAFMPALVTGPDGEVRASLKMPDSLTRYRVMAVAADEARRFGSGDASITARKRLMVRPSPPRFLNYGDRAELPVVVQNQGERPVDVSVALRASNAKLTGDRGYRFTVPVGDRREVRFDVATAGAGRARFQVAAAAEDLTDAAEFSLPVYTPATSEAFATYGTTDSDAVAQRLVRPDDVIEGFGGLEIITASTQLQALTDAFLYLQTYPYECSEQLASRIISVMALKDVLAAFETEDLPAPEEILTAMKRDIERLGQKQNWDGGWGFWRSASRSWPFVSVHAMHALERARAKGFAVDRRVFSAGRRYLRNIRDNTPADYPASVVRAIEAYALYTRAMMGELDEERALALIDEAGGVEALPLETAGWLYPVLTDGRKTRAALTRLRRRLANATAETAGEAHFVTTYEDGAHLLLHSDRRADALLLEGILRDRPKDVIVPKLVRGLLAHRTKGRWASTQENTWVLLALERYFRTYEGVTPDFVARVWLGDKYAGEQAYRGRTTDQHRWFIPMAQLDESEALLLAKSGAGRLYYRLGLKYAPASLDLEPVDRGFAVTRRYEGIESADDVRRDADGTWRVRAGALVRVQVQMVAPARRYHVALVDPLPAGLEALNPALAVTGDVPDAPPTDARLPWWWLRPWFEHQNLKDERAEAFSSLLYAGVYTYDYVTRATTPGRFVVPPAKAEQMYAPETFGRSGTDRFIVE